MIRHTSGLQKGNEKWVDKTQVAGEGFEPPTSWL